MTTNNILKADFLDLLFDNRNKQYGAYTLRRDYTKRLWTALAVTLLTVGAALWIFQPAAAETIDKAVQVREVILANVEELKPPPPPPPPPVKEEPAVEKPLKKAAPAPITARPKMKTTKFTPPVIKEDQNVKETDVPVVEEIATVDVVTTEGIKTDEVVANIPEVQTPKGTGDGKAVVAAPEPKKEDVNKIFEKVEIEASVNVGRWRAHLERNLIKYIEDAVYAGMQPGKYTVSVRFLVERDGAIGQVTALNDPGFGLAQGAVQVVKTGPKWNPGEQNGRKVRSYHTQPVTFVILDS